MTNKKIEISNMLQEAVSSGKVSQEVLDEIISMTEKKEIDSTIGTKEDTETLLKIKLMNETDWRKKAAISAQIISNSLDI